MNAGCRVAVLSLFGWRIDSRQPNHALYWFSAYGHRRRLSVLIPNPELSGGQPSVYAKFGIVCRLTNFILKRTSPLNHQTTVARTCLPYLTFGTGNFSHLQEFVEAHPLEGPALLKTNPGSSLKRTLNSMREILPELEQR